MYGVCVCVCVRRAAGELANRCGDHFQGYDGIISGWMHVHANTMLGNMPLCGGEGRLRVADEIERNLDSQTNIFIINKM